MAIRFKYDAAAVAIPQNEARQRFGQQLVLQQQKYANDQRQTMRDQAYDQQRQFAQNAFQLQREQERRNQLGQQALADLNAKQVFGAQQADAAKIAQKQKEKQAAEKAENENLARLKAQERADDEEAIKFGGYDPVTASELRKSYALDTKIDLNPDYDEAMRADAHRQNQENRRKLQESRIATPSMADRANQNLSYYVPSLQRYAKPEELQGLKQADPNIEVQVFQDGKMLPGPTPKQGPMTAQDHYRSDGAKFDKDLASKMAPLQDKVDDGTLTLEDGQSVRDLAWKQMQEDYDFKQKALGGGQPAQGGQPAMPPMQGQQPVAPPAPVEQPPVLGMQDLEPTYNADGTTSAPGQQAAMPVALGQQEKLQRDFDALRGLEAGQPTDALPIEQTGTQPPSQNVWAEVAMPEQQKAKMADVADTVKKPVVAPDFAKLSKNAGFKADREVLSKMKEAYENAKTPEIQNAISVLVTPGVPAYKKALAARALRAAGVDLDKLIPSASADTNIDFSSAGVM